MRKNILIELTDTKETFESNARIDEAIAITESELVSIEETLLSLKTLEQNCDKTDYMLAACSGVLCGIIDIFLVNIPNDSPAANMTDTWFNEKVEDFARLLGWDSSAPKSHSSAIRYLEKRFRIPYDQRGTGDSGSLIFDLTPSNHHFKSLGHNPSILGLFFSIMDQFTNTSHFVSDGNLIALTRADGNFELQGNSFSAKIFCGATNWLGHLISDISGSSNSKKRGLGIPSPFWTWTNDIIAIKRSLGINPSEFDLYFNEVAKSIYLKGYDLRYQTAQLIPVIVNELVVRLTYSTRRLIRYYSSTVKNKRSFSDMWISCEPFSNPTVKRMLTIAHGTFCIVDIGDAFMRTYTKDKDNSVGFFMRLNVVGIGRFTFSLYGEIKTELNKSSSQTILNDIKREKIIIENHLEGLRMLSNIYADDDLVKFISDFEECEMYNNRLNKSTQLASLRNVSSEKILMNKNDIDDYFRGKNNEE